MMIPFEIYFALTTTVGFVVCLFISAEFPKSVTKVAWSIWLMNILFMFGVNNSWPEPVVIDTKKLILVEDKLCFIHNDDVKTFDGEAEYVEILKYENHFIFYLDTFSYRGIKK